MAHFAKLDENNSVLQVVVVNNLYEADGENWCKELFSSTNSWKQTSYNTRGGVHYTENSNTPDGGTAIRKNYAGIGYSYNPTLDAFIPPPLFPSWLLDETTCQWESPVPAPDDGNMYGWNEDSVSWVLRPL